MPQPNDELGRSLRDQYFALADAGASEAERRRFRALVEALEVEPTLVLDGLDLCWHPSARFRVPRFVDAAAIPEPLRARFARPSAALPELAAAFVDPEEFSYRNFENILPLDAYFEGLPLALELAKREKLGRGKQPTAYGFRLIADERVRAALTGLDELGLYTTPLNAASRGGRRFIFHSAQLSAALGPALVAALPKTWAKGFSHVNPVFRCNRFEPGEAKFHRHLDTPYYDAARKQVSRYTLLIYLSGGEASPDAPALQIGDDVALARVEALTCVVFRQDLEHEGAPYLAGRKVFLRTELVFEHATLDHDPGIASLFAKACYLTGESLIWPELAQQSAALYDRAAAAHWGGPATTPTREPWLHKRWRGLEFVTNGHDYWFAKQAADLKTCAVVALLDQLNCKVGAQAFRKLCESELLDDPRPASEWIPATLARSTAPGEPAFVPLDLGVLFPPAETIDPRICCAFHVMPIFDASRSEETVSLYERAQGFAARRIRSAPITMLGHEVFVDPDKIVVERGRIHVLGDQPLAPLNFAACWNDGSDPSNYLDVEALVDAPHLLVPPILFVETASCYHLMLDLFRNSWLVEHRPRRVPVPRLRNLGFEDYEGGEVSSTPWFDAADRCDGDQGVRAKVHEDDDDEDEDDDDEDEDDEDEDVDSPWWANARNRVIRELYADDDE